MNKTSNTYRKTLKNKMAKALNDEIKTLPAGMQEILVDDLVTAFQNRIKVVKQASSNFEYYVELGVTVTQ
jgi:hypothetical protein